MRRPAPGEVRRVACIGGGIIGGGWAAAFLGRGLEVVVQDIDPEAEGRLRRSIEAAWPSLEAMGLAPGARPDRAAFTTELAEAVAEADFVQESGPERLDVKQAMYRAMDEAMDNDVVIASSTSGFRVTELQARAANPARIVLGHPFNPPYLMPLVEVAGGRGGDAGAVDWACEFYRLAGKHPLRMERELPGHIGDRLQQAMWNEILHMVAAGEATPEQIDESIVHGFGPRLGIMGTCLVFHLAGGMRAFLEHFEPKVSDAWTRLPSPPMTEDLIEKMAAGCARLAAGRSMEELRRLRDEALVGFLKHRQRLSAARPDPAAGNGAAAGGKPADAAPASDGMPAGTSRRVVLRRYPRGAPRAEDFELVEAPTGRPGPGQALLRAIYLSVDPYMRGRLRPGPSYAEPQPIGEVMIGETVAEVLESRADGVAAGDFVAAPTGWQTHAVAEARDLRRLDPEAAPLTTALGVLGMPGLTAYFGTLEVLRPRPGETLVVNAASGAVGGTVGQIARIAGCRVVGIVGSREKLDFIVEELGFDAGIDRRAGGDMEAALRAACPEGIDCYFDNVGGAISDAAFANLALGARVAVCGQISQYNDVEQAMGPRTLRHFLVKRATLRGLLVSDWRERHGEGRARLTRWLREGRIKYREDIVDGLDNAVGALAGLMEGRNFGKQLVRIGADPTSNALLRLPDAT